MPQARDPRTDRRTVRLLDQHGRAYSASLDIRSGAPTGLIDPLWVHQKGYSVPAYLVPPQQHIKFYGDDRPGEVYIDYDGWLADRKAGWRQHNTTTRDVELKIRGDKADTKNPSAETREIVGPHPQRVELLLAMKKGNKWALGLSEKRPEWADQYIPLEALENEEEFPDVPDDEPTASDEDAERKPAGRRGRPRGGKKGPKPRRSRPPRQIPAPAAAGEE